MQKQYSRTIKNNYGTNIGIGDFVSDNFEIGINFEAFIEYYDYGDSTGVGI